MTYRHSLSAVCAAILLALPVATTAQTPAQQYDAIRDIYLPPGLEVGGDGGLDAVGNYLAPLAGNWLSASNFFEAGDSIEDMAEGVARACSQEQALNTVTVIRPYAFEISRSRQSGGETFDFAMRYDHLSGTYFGPSYELEDFVRFIGFEIETIPPQMLYNLPPRRPVTVLRPSADTFVLSSSNGRSEIFLRCR